METPVKYSHIKTFLFMKKQAKKIGINRNK